MVVYGAESYYNNPVEARLWYMFNDCAYITNDIHHRFHCLMLVARHYHCKVVRIVNACSYSIALEPTFQVRSVLDWGVHTPFYRRHLFNGHPKQASCYKVAWFTFILSLCVHLLSGCKLTPSHLSCLFTTGILMHSHHDYLPPTHQNYVQLMACCLY